MQRREISENLGVLRLCSFPEIWKSAAPFVSGNFRKFKAEFSKRGNSLQKKQVSGANLSLLQAKWKRALHVFQQI